VSGREGGCGRTSGTLDVGGGRAWKCKWAGGKEGEDGIIKMGRGNFVGEEEVGSRKGGCDGGWKEEVRR
jgi:hypothetical protein